MRVIGITSVWNAAATIRICLLHHMMLGLERILVLDNGSTDATPTILRRLAKRIPLTVIRDDGPFEQEELMTGLLHEAARLGADWVIPFDADEFLVSDTPFFVERLGQVERDGMLVDVVNFVQHRSCRRDSPRALLTMETTPEHPADPSKAPELARTAQIALVEAEWPRKLILRASQDARLEVGNHGATGIGELELALWCRFLHAPLRSPGGLKASAEHGRRIRPFLDPDAGWQHYVMADAEEAGRLDEQWRWNSWDEEMKIGPSRAPLVRDTRLADAVRPWVRSPVARLAARLSGRSF